MGSEMCIRDRGKAEDCVGPIIFLSSDTMSGYITGQILEINGGQFIS